jgi:hypothetical protein
MVKTPKMRHSKSRREPVTIDLEPGAVSRIVDEDAAKSPATSEEAQAAEGSQAEIPEEPVHADQTDLEPWEHADAAGQAGTEPPLEAKAAGPELPYPGSDAPSDGAKASDYNFEDASAKRADDSKATGTRGEKMAPTPSPARRGGVNGIAAGLIGGVIALVGAGGLQLRACLARPVPAPVFRWTASMARSPR